MALVILPIFMHTSETATKNKCGIDIDMEDCEVRDIIFFNINAICAYTDDNYSLPSPYSEIHANGSEYICALPLEKVKKLIGL